VAGSGHRALSHGGGCFRGVVAWVSWPRADGVLCARSGPGDGEGVNPMKRFECKLTLVETAKYNLVIEADSKATLERRLMEMLETGRPKEGLYEFVLSVGDFSFVEVEL